MATRMFCWRSAISGSRRKADLPAMTSWNTAPVMMSVTVIATTSSIRLKPF